MTGSLKRFVLFASLALCALAATVPAGAQPAANDHTVLILGGSVSGGATSIEALKAIAAGMDVEVVTDEQWLAKSASDFASYRALIIGDPFCAGPPVTASITAATSNAATWGPQVDGPVVVIGTDPTFHQGQGGAALIEKGIAFSVSDAAKTGAYITLSCYYHGTAAATPVPLLDAAFGGTFTVTGVGCFNNVHIVATHPALDGLTDPQLSNWGCSVHEAFDAWPLSFEVLALALIGTAYNAPDGSVGTPYIIARGVDVISDIDLEPREATNPVGTEHTLTATVEQEGAPLPEVTVTFRVIDGPHEGTTGTAPTNGSGVATFAYTGTTEGTDVIEASFVDSEDRTQRSNRAIKIWTGEGDGGKDHEPPSLKCPKEVVVPCDGPGGTVVEFVVEVGDNEDPDPTLVCEPESGSLFPPGTTVVTCTATDASGNKAECSFTVTVTGGHCPRSQGFWKNHPETWPVSSLELGSVSYSQSALIALLKQPVRGDASLILAKQLIAAKLNVANCAGGKGVDEMVHDADKLIGDRTLPAGIAPSSSLGKQMTALGGSLEKFNEGKLTPDCGKKLYSDLSVSDTDIDDGVLGETEARLLPNRPNPFAGTTSIGFALGRPATVRLAVFDIQGREIKVLADGAFGSGEHTTSWDGTDSRGRRVSTGVYLYRLDIAGQRFIQRMVLTD